MATKTTSKRIAALASLRRVAPKNGTVRQASVRQSSLWQKVDELIACVPESELAKLPKDLSINLDHYLYGVEKVEPWRPV